MKIKKNQLLIIFPFLLTIMLLGCMGTAKEQKSTTPGKETTQATSGRYYDFADILIPSGLKLDQKASFVHGGAQSKGGILVFSGRVEPTSLVGFFQQGMAKDGWKLISSFKYPNYLLFFTKGERTSAISISESTFSTKVEVRVGLTEQNSAQSK